MITLRPDQLELVEAARDALRTRQAVLARAPCGSGKTVVAGYIAQSMAERGKRLIFTVHRRHLLKQTALTFQRFGIGYGVIASGCKNPDPLALVQIASMPTLQNKKECYAADLVCADECHLSASHGQRKVLDYYLEQGSRILGFSASPMRLDGRPLGDIYDKMVFGRDERWLIDHGILSDYRLIAPVTPDLQNVGTSIGDYDKKRLAQIMDTPDVAGDIVKNWQKYASGKRTIAFGVNREHSRNIAMTFQQAGIPAASIDGEMTDAEIFEAVRQLAYGEIKVLANCMLMTEGFDLSAQVGFDVPIEALIAARPTQSMALNTQMNGRALRRKPEPAVILDHASNWQKHGLPCGEREWSLDGITKRQTETSIPIRTCPQCFGVFKPAPVCPYCGAMMPHREREIEHNPHMALEEVDKAAARLIRQNEIREESEARTLDDLIAIGQRRGYNNRWAYIRWRTRQARQTKKHDLLEILTDA